MTPFLKITPEAAERMWEGKRYGKLDLKLDLAALHSGPYNVLEDSPIPENCYAVLPNDPQRKVH